MSHGLGEIVIAYRVNHSRKDILELLLQIHSFIRLVSQCFRRYFTWQQADAIRNSAKDDGFQGTPSSPLQKHFACFFSNSPSFFFFLLLPPQTILLWRGSFKKPRHQYFYQLSSEWRESMWEVYINKVKWKISQAKVQYDCSALALRDAKPWEAAYTPNPGKGMCAKIYI